MPSCGRRVADMKIEVIPYVPLEKLYKSPFLCRARRYRPLSFRCGLSLQSILDSFQGSRYASGLIIKLSDRTNYRLLILFVIVANDSKLLHD
jgi:hypothetical protein